MQSKERDKGRQGGSHEGKGRRKEEGHDWHLPEVRHQNVQNFAQCLIFWQRNRGFFVSIVKK